MKEKNLFLLTNSFPFGTKELFLEQEIIYLSKGFDRVLIFACNNPFSNIVQRDLPENCYCYDISSEYSSFSKTKALKFLLSYYFIKEVIYILRRNRFYHFKKTISTALISLSKAYYIKERISKKILDNYNVFYSYWADDSALALALIDKEKGMRCCRAHGWDLYFESNQIRYLPFRKVLLSKLDFLFPISQKGKKYITQEWKITNPSKVVVARLGVTAQKKVTPSGTFTMVSCSNLIPLKRVELIIEGLSNITEHPFHWTHFGDGPEKERLVQLARAKLGSNINWEFKGRIPNAQVMQWYAENNTFLFINVSSSEGIPVSIMEAMSFGIPCIATNVGGNSEIVNEQNGKLLAENPTPQEISDAICAFFEPSVFKLKSEGAFLTWKEQYNGERNYTAFVKQLINLH
jgi:glycosyltransferase involved in cell wall biosynthesis